MLLIHQQQQPVGADFAPLSSKHDDTIESASVITAGLISVSLPASATKNKKKRRIKCTFEKVTLTDLKMTNSWNNWTDIRRILGFFMYQISSHPLKLNSL